MTLDIALSLAAAGWYVFPVSASTRRPVVKWGDAATTDSEQLATWWTLDHPDALVGVHAGRSGLVIVDIDEKNGKSGGAALAAADIVPPPTFHYATRSGGSHLVYAAPAGRDLTIGQNIPVEGVDIRAGVGFVVYNGPALDKNASTELAPAPDWSLLDRKTQANSDDDATVTAWLERTTPGKPTRAVRQAVAAVTPEGMDRADMLHAVTELVKLGAERGAGDAYRQARATYLKRYPDFAREWDNAAAGSVKRLGLPPVTFDIPKPERKALKHREPAQPPVLTEEQQVERKREYRIKKHDEAMAAERPQPGGRILEDGPLAAEFAAAFTGTWAWSEAEELMRYDGKVWRGVKHHAIVEAVRVELANVEIAEHEHAVRRGATVPELNKVRSLLSRNRARAVAELVIGILAEQDVALDADPDILNVQNGVVDLRTGALRPHDWRDYCTKIAGVEYDPDATDPDWDKALEALRPDVLPWLQMKVGQAATGHMAEDAEVPFLKGGGANGKSALINAWRGALGTYAVTVPDKVLLANANDHPTELTTLMGARFAITEELPEGRQLNTKRLKDIAGTPIITARKMRQDFVSWPATHTLFVTTNHAAVVVETDHGTWRRLVLVTFPWRFRKPGKKLKSKRDRRADPGLRDRLGNRPHPAVLAWIVRGAVAWYANDMSMVKNPKTVERDTRQWRHDSDPVMQFADEHLELDEGSAIWVQDMLREFNDWQESQGTQKWSARTIASRFEGHESLPGVTKKVVRFGRIVPSRPTLNGLEVMTRGPGARAEAWLGVRFRDDEAQHSGNVTDLHRDRRQEGTRGA